MAKLRKRRETTGLSRERVAALLDPPVSSKTIERWEKGENPIPGYRAAQLERIYTDALNGKAAA